MIIKIHFLFYIQKYKVIYILKQLAPIEQIAFICLNNLYSLGIFFEQFQNLSSTSPDMFFA